MALILVPVAVFARMKPASRILLLARPPSWP